MIQTRALDHHLAREMKLEVMSNATIAVAEDIMHVIAPVEEDPGHQEEEVREVREMREVVIDDVMIEAEVAVVAEEEIEDEVKEETQEVTIETETEMSPVVTIVTTGETRESTIEEEKEETQGREMMEADRPQGTREMTEMRDKTGMSFVEVEIDLIVQEPTETSKIEAIQTSASILTRMPITQRTSKIMLEMMTTTRMAKRVATLTMKSRMMWTPKRRI